MGRRALVVVAAILDDTGMASVTLSTGVRGRSDAVGWVGPQGPLDPPLSGPHPRSTDPSDPAAADRLSSRSLRRAHWLIWKQVEVDGRPAVYGEAGSGHPVVFLHGWGLDHRVYKRPLARLAAGGLRVIAPALPGFGGTAGLPPGAATLAGYAAWVGAFFEAIGLDQPVTLIGHSFGGGIAVLTAHDNPDRVHSLVLVNSIGGSAWKHHRGALRSITERPLWDWGLHIPADLLPQRQLTRVVPVIVGEFVGNLLRDPLSFWRTAALARSADLTEYLEELKRRRLPTVVLWGTRDRVVTQASFESMCRALGEPNVVTVEGQHSWMIADPDNFAEVMTNVVKIEDLASGGGLRQASDDR